MLVRVSRIPQRLTSCRSLLNHQLTIRHASTETVGATPKLPTRTAYVRTWRPVSNVVELYKLVRGVEKKYGKVMEVHFMKDFEDPTRYQMMCYLIFADPQSYQRIPEDGIELAVPLPGSARPLYELGISDIETELYNDGASEASKASDIPNGTPSLGFKLMRSIQDYLPDTLVRGIIYQNTSYRTMEHFQNWAGFAELQPMALNKPILDRQLFADPTGIDQTRMKASLQLCSRNFRPALARPAPQYSPKVAAPPSPSPTEKGSEPPSPALVTKAPMPQSKPAFVTAAEPPEEITPENVDDATAKAAKPPVPPTPSAPPKTSPTKKPAGPKLVIPPQVQSTAPPRKKDPKPKIKAQKDAPAKKAPHINANPIPKEKLEPRPQPAPQPEPQPQPESQPQQPEQEKPKSTLSKLWSLFSKS